MMPIAKGRQRYKGLIKQSSIVYWRLKEQHSRIACCPNFNTLCFDKMRVLLLLGLTILLTMASCYPPRYARHRHQLHALHRSQKQDRQVCEAAKIAGGSTTTSLGAARSVFAAGHSQNSTAPTQDEQHKVDGKYLKGEV